MTCAYCGMERERGTGLCQCCGAPCEQKAGLGETPEGFWTEPVTWAGYAPGEIEAILRNIKAAKKKGGD